MFGNIMVPLDGSELAEHALLPAQRLAVATGATLHLVRVIEPPMGTTWVPGPPYAPPSIYDDVMETQTSAATSYLEALRERLAHTAIPLCTAHPVGTAVAMLCAYERSAGIDLVVMCGHGRSGLARLALGSVADGMVHHGAAPVLLVRGYGPAVSLARAVVPLDGSARAEAALRLVDDLSRYVIREVTLLQVIATPEQRPAAERYLEGASQELHGENLVCTRQVEQGDPAQVIMAVAGADALVVMATHGRSGLARLALGSVADRVARESAAEVLLVRAAALPDAP